MSDKIDTFEELFQINRALATEVILTPEEEIKEDDLSANTIIGLRAKSAYAKAVKKHEEKQLTNINSNLTPFNLGEVLSKAIEAVTARKMIMSLSAANDPIFRRAAEDVQHYSDVQAMELYDSLLAVGAFTSSSED